MANGVVPVVTGDASMKVVVRSSHNGLIVSKRDPADRASKILALLQDEGTMRRLSQAAERTIRDHYGIEGYLSALESIYQRSVALPGSHIPRRIDDTHSG